MGLDFSVRHNIDAMFAHRQATLNNTSLTKALERLSSGYRINRASDDAAGLAVSEKLRTQVRGFQQALRNVQDGISMVQVAEAGLAEITDILQRIRDLAVQASNGIYTDSDRVLIQQEVDQLLNEVNRMQTAIEFNRIRLLDGTYSSRVNSGYGGTIQGGVPQDIDAKAGVQLPSGSTYIGSLVFHIGASEGQVLKVNISTLSVQAMGLASLFSSTGAVSGYFQSQFNLLVKQGKAFNGVLSTSKADSAIGIIDSALNVLASQRSKLGAIQNRLDHTFNYVGIAAENLQAAESRIRDTDMAAEIIEFTKAQVLVQSSQAMLAQANLKPTSILQLLG